MHAGARCSKSPLTRLFCHAQKSLLDCRWRVHLNRAGRYLSWQDWICRPSQKCDLLFQECLPIEWYSRSRSHPTLLVLGHHWELWSKTLGSVHLLSWHRSVLLSLILNPCFWLQKVNVHSHFQSLTAPNFWSGSDEEDPHRRNHFPLAIYLSYNGLLQELPAVGIYWIPFWTQTELSKLRLSLRSCLCLQYPWHL